MDSQRKPPTLVHLCTRVAINNLRYIRNVAAVPAEILEGIMSHCTVEQLAQIEDATEERDLSPVTDKLWKHFYEHRFGADKTISVVRNMERKGAQFKWRALYDATIKMEDEKVDKGVQKMKDSYLKQQEMKKSRQIRLCSKQPPSQKRFFRDTSSSLTSYQNPLMKKAKIECLNRSKLKMHAPVRTASTLGNGFSSKSSCLEGQATARQVGSLGAPQVRKAAESPLKFLEDQELLRRVGASARNNTTVIRNPPKKELSSSWKLR